MCEYTRGVQGEHAWGGHSWQREALELTMPPLKTAAQSASDPLGRSGGCAGGVAGCSVLLAPPGTLSL